MVTLKSQVINSGSGGNDSDFEISKNQLPLSWNKLFDNKSDLQVTTRQLKNQLILSPNYFYPNPRRIKNIILRQKLPNNFEFKNIILKRPKDIGLHGKVLDQDSFNKTNSSSVQQNNYLDMDLRINQIEKRHCKKTVKKMFPILEKDPLHNIGIVLHDQVITEITTTAKTFNMNRSKFDYIEVPEEILKNSKLSKFWRRRYHLFSKFDEGIKMDEESWYSVTPELLAKHIAERCKCDVIVDAFCGAGGNTIQFALTCKKVIAIDIDPKKIELAKNNARVYGVEDKIEFIVSDFFDLVDKLKADIVFFSPPWGGPTYVKEAVFDLNTMLQPVPISKLLEAGRKITENIAVFLPKNSNVELLYDKNSGRVVEVEKNYFKDLFIAITAYYNNLIKVKIKNP